MLLVIPNVLDKNQLKVIRTLLQSAAFVDGKLSAGDDAADVKNNQELAQQTPSQEALHRQLNQMVMPSLLNHPDYQNSVFPLKVATPFYARYETGMAYGEHLDDPIMGSADSALQQRYRTDVSTTVFLNDDYEGGELVIRTANTEQRIKPQAGAAVVYASSYLHRVSEVLSGTRLVAVTWAQSIIKDTAQRELLYELNQAREGLAVNHQQPTEDQRKHLQQLANVHANLVRRWSDL